MHDFLVFNLFQDVDSDRFDSPDRDLSQAGYDSDDIMSDRLEYLSVCLLFCLKIVLSLAGSVAMIGCLSILSCMKAGYDSYDIMSDRLEYLSVCYSVRNSLFTVRLCSDGGLSVFCPI